MYAFLWHLEWGIYCSSTEMEQFRVVIYDVLLPFQRHSGFFEQIEDSWVGNMGKWSRSLSCRNDITFHDLTSPQKMSCRQKISEMRPIRPWWLIRGRQTIGVILRLFFFIKLWNNNKINSKQTANSVVTVRYKHPTNRSKLMSTHVSDVWLHTAYESEKCFINSIKSCLWILDSRSMHMK